MQLAQVMTCVRLSQGFETFQNPTTFFELYATVLGKLWGWFTRSNPCRMNYEWASSCDSRKSKLCRLNRPLGRDIRRTTKLDARNCGKQPVLDAIGNGFRWHSNPTHHCNCNYTAKFFLSGERNACCTGGVYIAACLRAVISLLVLPGYSLRKGFQWMNSIQ